MRRMFIAALLTFAASVASASASAPIALSDTDGQELTLDDLSIRTAIHGVVSLTEVELRFRNPKPRRIEGRFTCTLPANAAISRFAKEVNGNLMEGEVVERVRANQVYEQFLHQMRDPALLEQDQGNRFSARIFPIEANAQVRILFSYSQLLPMRGGARTYSLLLRGLPKVGSFRFRGLVTPLRGEGVSTASTRPVHETGSLTSSAAEVYSIDETDYTPEHDVTITLRQSADAPRAQLIRSGDFYVASFRPAAGSANAEHPHDWLFFVDTSASGAESQTHRIRAIQQLIASLPHSDHVEVEAFDQDIVPLAGGSASDVAASIAARLRDRLFLGGTDLGALFRRVSTEAAKHPRRAIVIASDFVATLGTTDRKELNDLVNAIPHTAPVDALVLGAREESSLARSISARRGHVVHIPFSEALDSAARDATHALQLPAGASFDIADASSEWVYPQHVDDVQAGDEVLVLGKVRPSHEPHVALTGVASAPSSSSIDAHTFAPLLEREAYRAYLDYLAERETNEPSEAVRRALATEQVKISTEQRVVIPRTTMLVLESEWDYQRFGLDRRALAAILTIDAGGIARLDRHTSAPAPLAGRRVVTDVPLRGGVMEKTRRDGDLARPVPQPAPVPPPPPPVSEAPQAIAAPVVASAPAIEGGVVGGVVGGVIANRSAAVPPDGRTSVREEVRVGARAPRPEAKRSDADWYHVAHPSKEHVARLAAAIAHDPRDRGLYNELSEALAAREEWPELRRLALAWQQYDPENAQVYEILGQADERLGNTTEAARADASLIEIAPSKTELLQRAGLLLVRAHRASLAEAPLRHALELRPDRANGYRHLALMLWLDGRVEEAARVLESATKQTFPNWYGDVQRVIREELGYVYRAWMAKEPSRRIEIAARAHEHDVDLSRHDALRVTLAWETDANDVDLHLVDPTGAECYYGNRQIASGFELYQDITQGLGPEVIRGEHAKRGVYHVGVRYFAAGPMGISRGIVVIMRDDGHEQPSVDIVPFRLAEGGGAIRHVAAITVK